MPGPLQRDVRVTPLGPTTYETCTDCGWTRAIALIGFEVGGVPHHVSKVSRCQHCDAEAERDGQAS